MERAKGYEDRGDLVWVKVGPRDGGRGGGEGSRSISRAAPSTKKKGSLCLVCDCKAKKRSTKRPGKLSGIMGSMRSKRQEKEPRRGGESHVVQIRSCGNRGGAYGPD